MTRIQDLQRQARKLPTLLLILLPVSVSAQTLSPEAVLGEDSEWTVNIDGHKFRTKLRGGEHRGGRSGWVRRGIEGSGGKGVFKLQWDGHEKRVQMTVPVSANRQVNCEGRADSNISFLAGTCAGTVPFVMTPGASPTESAAQLSQRRRLELCEHDLKMALPRGVRQQRGSTIARDLARNAAQNLPHRSPRPDSACPTCDTAPVLDVPLDPPDNTDEGRWLAFLLRAQMSAIFDMFDVAGQRELQNQEDSLCRQLERKQKKCTAIYRQNVITGAVEKLVRGK